MKEMFDLDSFKKDCAEKLVGVTKVEGLTRMDLHRFRKGKFSKALTVEKFMILCDQMRQFTDKYTNSDLVP